MTCDHAMASDSCKAILGMSGRGPRYPAELLRVARDLGNDGNARKVECGSSGAKLARLITLFGEHSSSIFLRSEIRVFFRKWYARQDSNLRPSA